MSSPVSPQIFAKVTLLPTAVGGRKTPILSGDFRSVLGIGHEHFSARLEIPEGIHFEPGSTMDLGIQFLFPEAALPNFPVGTTFTVWEGRDIGHGQVTSVIADA
jgi:hypothetical protein